MPPKAINHQHTVSFSTRSGEQVQFRAMDAGWERKSFNQSNGTPVTFAMRTPPAKRSR